MDHLIEEIITYMDMDIEQLKEEYVSREYGGLKLCPTYRTVKCYCDAIKSLNKMDGGYTNYTTPKGCLEQRGVYVK